MSEETNKAPKQPEPEFTLEQIQEALVSVELNAPEIEGDDANARDVLNTWVVNATKDRSDIVIVKRQGKARGDKPADITFRARYLGHTATRLNAVDALVAAIIEENN